MTQEIIQETKERMEKALANLQEEFNTIRVGRANPHILDRIEVDYYGSMAPIQQVANVSVPEGRVLQIQPWDAHMLKAIEKAINMSEIGIHPTNDGKVIRLVVPELNEERRLAYVGITRAKEKLYLIKTRERMLFGSTTHNRESRFVNEIPSSLLEKTGNENTFAAHKVEYQPQSQQRFDPFAKKRPATAPTTNKYAVGNTVFHKVFGTGMVLNATPMGNDTMLEIAFDKVGTKTLMANFAKMEIIK